MYLNICLYIKNNLKKHQYIIRSTQNLKYILYIKSLELRILINVIIILVTVNYKDMIFGICGKSSFSNRK